MTARFVITETRLSGLRVIQRQRLGDSRGYLERVFCRDELVETGWTKPISQINNTFTVRKGTVRGMHFQRPPYAEMKLVMCLSGEVFDVALDLRMGSPTFMQWHGEVISDDNCRALLIPEGFAHGFQALTDNVRMLYLHSAPYAAQAEGGIHPQDPTIVIRWPLAISELSPRDAGHPTLNESFEGMRI